MAIKPISVKQLNSYIKNVLKSDPVLANVAVSGEISNFKLHSSGHVYFNLKDESSKVNCFLPGSIYESLDFMPEEGMQVIASGYINIYERGGSYSLNIRKIEVEGTGDLAIAFDRLKKKLEEEGLFDEQNKKSIPSFPEKIAVVTSETGAAIQDILKIIKNKNNYTDVLIYPTLVQGEAAAAQIAGGISDINKFHPDTDCMIIGRGGGSIEELWAFNEEIVARAIFASEIPVISAVGHETDFTISDFVADKRAETPSAAANMAVPDADELRFYIDDIGESLKQDLDLKVERLERKLWENRLDSLKNQLINTIGQDSSNIKYILSGMSADIREMMIKKEHSFEKYLEVLEALDPKQIMSRGYAALSGKDGRLIDSVKKLNRGDKVKAMLIDGSAVLDVESVK